MNAIAKMNEETRINRAKFLTGLFETLELETPKKAYQIINVLHTSGLADIDTRTWRKFCEETLYLYQYGYLDKLVVGTSKGYIYTSDKSLIDDFLKRKHNQFIALASNYYSLKRCMENEPNLTIEEFLIAEAKHLA